MKLALAILITVSAAFAQQLQFSWFDSNGNETTVSGSYAVAPTAVGDKLDFRLRLRNAGSTSVSVPRVAISGQGFTITSVSPPVPTALAPAGFMEIFLRFTPTIAGSYSANLAINSSSIILFGSSITAPFLSITVNGQKQDLPGGSTIDFGRVQTGKTSTITVSIENRSSRDLAVQLMTLSGAGFRLATSPAFPLNLAPTEIQSFDLEFAPGAGKVYSGSLQLDTRIIPLAGTGYDPPFPALSILVETSLASGVQSKLSIQLPSPAPAPASGTLRLDFTPSAGSKDDSAIRFLNAGGRALSFSFNAGDRSASFGTSSDAVFQTGTTAGTLTFLIDFQLSTKQIKSTIVTEPVQIDSTVSNRPNDTELSIQLTGFDNTHAATQLAFTFYDSTGAVIQPGRITYDAARDFSQFFRASTAGGMFTLLAQFPVKGSTAKIATVDVDLVNPSGTTTVTKLRF